MWTRRRWIGAWVAAAWPLAACHRSEDARGRLGADTLRIFNWSDYCDPEIIPQFERETDCTVIYDNYSSDAELETRLATGGGAYDVVFPSDRAMHALLAKNLLRELEHSALPNFRHLDAQFLSPPVDPGNRFSVPYFWGTLAVGIRTDKCLRTAAGFEPLFDDGNRGRITMLDDLENTVAAVLLHLGLPLNSVEPAHLQKARQLLLEQKPLLQAYTSDSYKERLISGDAWAALGWSGDLSQAAREEARIAVVVPRQGTMMWLDSMVIPRAARNAALAHRFINFMLSPETAERNALAVQYATPNATARARLPQSMLSNESIYLPAATLAQCDWLRNRGPLIERVEAIWREVRQ